MTGKALIGSIRGTGLIFGCFCNQISAKITIEAWFQGNEQRWSRS